MHVYFANILLMNFLIAILAFTYEKMQEISVFKYKVNLYMYSERYLIAFGDENYSELLVHPPPVSLITALFLPLMTVKPWVPHLNKSISYLVYWLENFVAVIFFFLYEVLIIPIVWCKIFWSIITTTQGLFTTIFYTITWIFTGLIFTFTLIIRDIYFLFKIFAMHQGCRAAMKLGDELKEYKVEDALKLKVYNEVRHTVIEIYIELRKQALAVLGDVNEEYDRYITEGNFNDLDVLEMLEST